VYLWINKKIMDTNDYPFKEECYHIIGACMNVHNELGCGFLEAVYQEALLYEFIDLNIPAQKEKVLDVYYKHHLLEKKYVADFLCFHEVILELKAVEVIHPEHIAQVLNYLKATGKKIGLLVNFGTTKLQYKRIIL
jgi:GxxExxY protein